MAMHADERKDFCGGLPYDLSCSKLPGERWREETPVGGCLIKGWFEFILVVVLTHAGGVAVAGNLGIGAPTVEEQRIALPIVLNSGSDGVAALNFRLIYDPDVFAPVSVEPGRAALGANKQVTGNMPSPGEYVVVMMGFNQTTVSAGDIARILFRQVGEAEDGFSRVTIEDTALARWDGTEMPSEGGTSVIRLNEASPETPDTPETPAKPETPPALPEDEEPAAQPVSQTGLGGGLLARIEDKARDPGIGPSPAVAAESEAARDTGSTGSKGGLDDAAERAAQARGGLGEYAPVEADNAAPEPGVTGNSTGETNAGLGSRISGGSTVARLGTVESEQEDGPTGVASGNSSGASRSRLRVVTLGAGLVLAAAGLLLVARKRLSS